MNTISVSAAILLAIPATSPGQSSFLHQFGYPKINADHTILLTLTNSVVSTLRNYYDLFPVESSQGLMNWVPLVTLVRTNSSNVPLVFSDSESTNLAQRFYRTPTNQLVTPIPRPQGPYAVGTVSRLFSDPSRTNRYNIPTNISFMVQFWFPAEPRAGVLPAAYLNSAIAATWYSYYSHNDLAANSTLFQPAVSHALPDITISTNRAPFPVVLFSHGYQCVRTMDTDVMENLASFGFITVAIDHADAWASVFPSGQIVRGNAPDLPISTGQFSLNIQNRARDVRFVLDELTQLNQQDELFGGRFDLDHVGIMGHSLGGGVVAEVCADDGRFKAGLSLDGAHTNVLALQISQPFLIASGTDANPVMQPFRADFRKLFDQLSQNAYWLELTNSEHFDFVESPWFATSPLPSKIRTATVLRTYAVSFFSKYLKAEDDHFLDGPPAAYPEVEGFLRK